MGVKELHSVPLNYEVDQNTAKWALHCAVVVEVISVFTFPLRFIRLCLDLSPYSVFRSLSHSLNPSPSHPLSISISISVCLLLCLSFEQCTTGLHLNCWGCLSYHSYWRLTVGLWCRKPRLPQVPFLQIASLQWLLHVAYYMALCHTSMRNVRFSLEALDKLCRQLTQLFIKPHLIHWSRYDG